MLAFTRDPEVPQLSCLRVNTAVLRASAVDRKEDRDRADDDEGGAQGQGQGQTRQGQGQAAPQDALPPCCIVPFHRQSMYAAPLCFLFVKAEEAYFLFRALYARYFCRLHTISSQPDTILFLSKVGGRVLALSVL